MTFKLKHKQDTKNEQNEQTHTLASNNESLNVVKLQCIC